MIPSRPVSVLSAAAAALVLAALTGCGSVASGGWSSAFGTTHHRTWTRSMDAAAMTSEAPLDIRTRAGDVLVVASEAPPRIEVAASSLSADRLDELTVGTTVDAGVLKIEPEWPDGWKDGDACDIAVYLPARSVVLVRTAAGDATIEGMQGDLSISTSAGDIVVRRHRGAVDARSSAGDVELSRVNGPVRAKTSAGDISLVLVSWPVEAATSAGDIDAELSPGFDGTLRAETSAGDLAVVTPGRMVSYNEGSDEAATVVLGESDAVADFKTHAGDIRVVARPADNNAGG